MRSESLDLKQIKIKDPFWSKHVDLVKSVIIPYQWDAMNDRIEDAESSHCLENFRIAADLKEGTFYGALFQDTDVAKWLEAVGFSLAYCRDEELERTADEAIDLIAQAQQEETIMAFLAESSSAPQNRLKVKRVSELNRLRSTMHSVP